MLLFVRHIVDTLEFIQINGRMGWLRHLEGYEWQRENRNYQAGIKVRKDFRSMIASACHSSGPDADQQKHDVCNDIAKWGGIIKPVDLDLARKYFSTIQYLSNIRDSEEIECRNISGRRIATASKIYSFSDPRAWTIYDSRLAFALNQLAFTFQRDRRSDFEQIQDMIKFLVPKSQGTTDRHCMFGEEWNDRDASLWFVRASLLLRQIAEALNGRSIPAPEYCLDEADRWELYHVEMVLFMLGRRKWVGKTQ